MAKAGSDVLLAHAMCGAPAVGNLAMQASRPLGNGVSVPGCLSGAPAGNLGMSRGGVLGDITNVGLLPGGKAVGKPTKLSPITAPPGAAGWQMQMQGIVADPHQAEVDPTERRIDPMLDDRVVTYLEMRRGHANRQLTDKQLAEHWANLLSAGHQRPEGVAMTDAMVLTPRCNEDVEFEAADAEDPQQVAEYCRDIYGMMSNAEVGFLPRPDYLEAQPDINAKMRAILIDWLVEVHMKYKLKTETLFLAVNLIDRFLEKRSITRKKLQLVGVTGMLIAAKFEEIYPPEVRDFVYITDKAYTKEEILQMEVLMLTVLEFGINCPTVAHFFERYQRINRCNEAHRHLLQYVLELTLPDFKMLRYSPSHLAAAATLLSNKLLKQHPAWPQAMVRHTQQTELMVKACAKEMCGLLDAAERSPLQAVRKKFSLPKFHGVGKMTF